MPPKFFLPYYKEPNSEFTVLLLLQYLFNIQRISAVITITLPTAHHEEVCNRRAASPARKSHAGVLMIFAYLCIFDYLLSQNNIADTVNIFQRQICIQRKRQHTQCQMLCHRRFLCSSSRVVPITLKTVSQRVEIFSSRNPLLRQHLVNFIASIPQN